MEARNMERAQVFGMRLLLKGQSDVSSTLPRFYLEKFDLRQGVLEGMEDTPFIAAVAKSHPGVIASRNLVTAIRREDGTLPVAICMNRIDPSMKQALVSERIPFISSDGNAYLPFLAIQESPTSSLPEPKPFSPQAQRIALNLVAGRWNGATATDLAKLCGKSGASVTKYLKELEAIEPSLVKTSWKTRILENPWLTKRELLDLFEPFLVSPIAKTHRLAIVPDKSLLVSRGARLSGASALPFFSDLAHDNSHITVMMHRDEIAALKTSLEGEWREAAWYDDAPFVIEEWTYPLDNSSQVSLASTGLECVDPHSLYAAYAHDRHDDVRTEDAVEQLRGYLCQQ